MQKPHSPNCAHLPGCAESHGRLRLQALSSKHNVRHRGQRLRGVKAELSVDMEYEQIY
jgi:hypothetical protein